MRILALDAATQTGYAVGDNRSLENRSIESGIFKMPKRDVLGERLVIFHDTLSELIEHYKPDLIAYERPYVPAPGAPRGAVMVERAVAILSRSASIGQAVGILRAEAKKDGPPPIDVNTLNFLQKVEGMLIYTATARKLPYEAYASASWRKTALGYSRAPKGSPDGFLKKAMKTRAVGLGFDPQSYDESDAIGILIHALHGPPANERAQGDLLEMAREIL